MTTIIALRRDINEVKIKLLDAQHHNSGTYSYIILENAIKDPHVYYKWQT